MGKRRVILSLLAIAGLAAGGYFVWHEFWFFRNPTRTPPAETGLVSPADGTIVYVRRAGPGEEVVSIKQGMRATVADIVREDVDEPKLVIGIFMSPFNVHFNRAPLDATIDFIRHHPAHGGNAHMGAMHWRTLLGLEPHYAGSVHIVQNERTVTRFVSEYRGRPFPFYVVQIGARTVNGIDSYYAEGERVPRGTTFGMIRIGSQVDLIVPWNDDFEVRVQPGDRVRAGETILVR